MAKHRNNKRKTHIRKSKALSKKRYTFVRIWNLLNSDSKINETFEEFKKCLNEYEKRKKDNN